jgi:hypothetical protein
MLCCCPINKNKLSQCRNICSFSIVGPKHWVDQYPRCGGDRQSPVDISPGEVEYGSWLNELRFQGYEKYLGQGFSTPITIKNNGHTGMIVIYLLFRKIAILVLVYYFNYQ